MGIIYYLLVSVPGAKVILESHTAPPARPEVASFAATTTIARLLGMRRDHSASIGTALMGATA